MSAIGPKQLGLLATLGNPGFLLIVGGSKVARSLLRRRLLRSYADDGDSFLGIAPSGLRELAAAMEAGRLPNPTEGLRSNSERGRLREGGHG